MNTDQTLFDELKALETEQRNPDTMHIDLANGAEIAALINDQDKLVAGFVNKRLPEIGQAIEMIRAAFLKGGRLIYAGAGTSGRLGVLDAAECPPTFGTEPEQVIGLMAGGTQAMFVAQEGAEDSPEAGASDVQSVDIGPEDVLCGLAASGRTPYVLGAIKQAKKAGAGTIMVCCVTAGRVRHDNTIDIMIDVPVGQEVIMGSTRMKSATAQKMVCNMLTTGAMIRLGKVYENVMVDLKLTNKKLVERARRIIMMFTSLTYEEAAFMLSEADNHVKTALVMSLGNMDKLQARELLHKHDGFIRAALESLEA
ncbi:MAG: N-acetylmuramic acid 6-phosphate etherase MurQ [Bacteroidetes bacterium HLUCCA01]|nr:MAG: N-acetylmuramic acid 6-phosphate etherase MurQ [Bacteroidetes bacterium HLUCCA01]